MKCSYVQMHSEKNTKPAEYWLLNNNYTHYVYFETPYMVYYLGCHSLAEAKKKYQKIMDREKDLYGCVLSVQTL